MFVRKKHKPRRNGKSRKKARHFKRKRQRLPFLQLKLFIFIPSLIPLWGPGVMMPAIAKR